METRAHTQRKAQFYQYGRQGLLHQSLFPQRREALPQSHAPPYSPNGKEQERKKLNDLEPITPAKESTPDLPVATAVTSVEGYEDAQLKTQDADNRSKILVVEGNDELREYLRRTLAENYHVQVCSNGKSALYIIKEYFPDLIISDIMMPEMRGDELCQVVKTILPLPTFLLSC